ncbi:carbon starvation CstA family protein [uncultured Draconibacterium sp.]|uniref:carbon starvation CstA family protein n=1 Tax=uncultured Draconibacterium sp. TaxID=1573823 RepID=UPI002AA90D7C|nr:carbon starvation CstA family protein [uncultured Draconibacterium sp.]
MITFIISIAVLVAGYFIYGSYVDRKFKSDPTRPTPAIEKNDGVDYVPLKTSKIFLIQFLNIAGLGPIFGAIAGAMWGPVAFIWIVLGSVFAGGVHDYFSGMLSLRHGGESIPEIVGKYLGVGVKNFMRIFALVLLILVGVVFVKGPATILAGLSSVGSFYWVFIIFLYYILATMIPIDKLIGKVYPFFGGSLLVMALGIFAVLLFGKYTIPDLTPATFSNMHANPGKFPVFPMLFITIACGAISGFHSTQSPLMARCLSNEADGKKIFFGAMITEGIVALIWAAAAMAFFGGVRELGETMALPGHNAAWVVNQICDTMLGKIGGLLAIIGVVAAPITSGDTAFRSARLTIADTFSFKQGKLVQRLVITIPIFIVAILLTTINFDIIWRYFGWSNQTLATIVLWTAAVYMLIRGENFWIALIPAIFMTAVVTTYILVAPEGLMLPYSLSVFIGCVITIILTGYFFFYRSKKVVLGRVTISSVRNN